MNFKAGREQLKNEHENQAFEISQNYKLFLFQNLYQHFVDGTSLSSQIDPTMSDFVNKIQNDLTLVTIYKKIIEEALLYNIENAYFYADKLCSITYDHPISVYLLGECYFLGEEYVKISYIFSRSDLLNLNENFALLVVKGFIKLKMFSQALKVLTSPFKSTLKNERFSGELAFLTGKCQKYLENRHEAESNFIISLNCNSSNFAAFEGLCETRQHEEKTCHSLINRLNFDEQLIWVKKFYQLQLEYLYNDFVDTENQQSISANIFGKSRNQSPSNDSMSKMQIEINTGAKINDKKVNFGGFFNNLQSKQESRSIEEGLYLLKKTSNNYDQKNDFSDETPIKSINKELEEIKLKADESPIISAQEKKANELLCNLKESENIHFLYLKLCYHFKNFQINNAYEICKKILDQNQFHFETILIYSEILIEKEEISELFSYSSKLAENFPDHFATFHIFGMYYFYLKKYDAARRYFNKAIHLNNYSLQTWLMLGHTYAAQEESDPASNVYRSCLKLFPNSHLPHMYIGMEYLRINNLKTAAISFNHAKKIAGENPMIYNEIGCIYLKQKKYEQAKKSFKKALKCCQANGINWLKHSILNNLANVHRKDKEYTTSIQYYEQSLALCPNDPSVLFSLAFCYNLTGELTKAAALYHKVVNKKYDSHFVNHMLSNCMVDLAEKNFTI